MAGGATVGGRLWWRWVLLWWWLRPKASCDGSMRGWSEPRMETRRNRDGLALTVVVDGVAVAAAAAAENAVGMSVGVEAIEGRAGEEGTGERRVRTVLRGGLDPGGGSGDTWDVAAVAAVVDDDDVILRVGRVGEEEEEVEGEVRVCCCCSCADKGWAQTAVTPCGPTIGTRVASPFVRCCCRCCCSTAAAEVIQS